MVGREFLRDTGGYGNPVQRSPLVLVMSKSVLKAPLDGAVAIQFLLIDPRMNACGSFAERRCKHVEGPLRKPRKSAMSASVSRAATSASSEM
jgi:hypothetical protein